MSKLLVLVAIIAAIWYGFRILARRNRPIGSDRGGGRLDEDRTTVHDTESCRECGAFVPTGAARDCGRAGCPYPV